MGGTTEAAVSWPSCLVTVFTHFLRGNNLPAVNVNCNYKITLTYLSRVRFELGSGRMAKIFVNLYWITLTKFLPSSETLSTDQHRACASHGTT